MTILGGELVDYAETDVDALTSLLALRVAVEDVVQSAVQTIASAIGVEIEPLDLSGDLIDPSVCEFWPLNSRPSFRS